MLVSRRGSRLAKEEGKADPVLIHEGLELWSGRLQQIAYGHVCALGAQSSRLSQELLTKSPSWSASTSPAAARPLGWWSVWLQEGLSGESIC